LSAFLSRPNHVVIAALRDPNSESSKALHDLPHGKDSKVILLKIDSASETDALAAVNILTSEHKITRLDVVIANAGISNYFGKATITPVEQMLEHFKINSVAPLLLFQATAPLINAATNAKFVTITSGAGSISGMDKLRVENTAYGTSKAALNFITRKIHFENPNLIAFPINPGWLQTEAGNPQSPMFRCRI
jgi:norsolorinic acid ketoreductase